MTGYGRGESDRGGAKISVEVNSVNRKQSDIVINLPRELSALEPRVRQLVGERLTRGRTNVVVACDRSAIDLERDQGKAFAVEHQRGGRARGGIGLEFQRRAHRGLRWMQFHVEIDGLDQPVGGTVFGQADGAVFFGAHHVLETVTGGGPLQVGRDLGGIVGRATLLASQVRIGIACSQQQRVPGRLS